MRRVTSGEPGRPRLPLSSASVANALIIVFLLAAALLQSADSDLYYLSVQEDGGLEWMTFWAFILAAIVFGVQGKRSLGRGILSTWFLWGLAAFCFFVAMEEISWGQRVLGYRPPSYFLSENFQQELNVHNVFSTSLRKFTLKTVILGYGVFLPLLALVPAGRRLFARFGVVSPPVELVPAFLVTFGVYQTYPWEFSGELVELMLGLGFLFAAVSILESPADTGRKTVAWWRFAVAFAVAALLAAASVQLSHLQRRDDAETVNAAKAEMGALAQDFRHRGQPLSRCGIHKRVFSYIEKYDVESLLDGRFTGLVDRGLPEERAEFFIDPWNSPIWIRHKCNKDRTLQRAFVYSFGPNRRRESSQWEIRGDDIGAVFFAIGQ